jgi:hypothetical protein
MQKWEITKSNRSKCMTCSFEGMAIPKDSKRLRRWSGMGQSTRTEFLCERCALSSIKEQIEDLRKLAKQAEEEVNHVSSR